MKPVIKSLIAVFSLAGLCTPLSAQALTFLQQKNPSNLGLFVGVSDACPFNEEVTIKRSVREFRQAGLTATESLSLNLNINVDCMPIRLENNKVLGISIYNDTRWGTQLSNGSNVLYEEPSYGSYLIVPTNQPDSYYLDKIAESIKKALMHYRKVNF